MFLLETFLPTTGNSKMYLGNKAIKKGISRGFIKIEPFKEENLQLVSYDVSLGEFFWFKDHLGTWFLIKDEYALLPKCSVLAHTEEFVGTSADSGLSTQLVSKSTPMRNLIAVADTAGWGDPGFFSRYTFPITNRSNETIVLKKGQSLAQVAFFEVRDYNGDYSESGNYMTNNWKPQDMLPKGYRECVI